MQDLANYNPEATFTSKELVELINYYREDEAKKAKETATELLHFTLLAKIEKEFSEEIGGKKLLATSYTDSSNRQSKCYELIFDQALQLLMSESKTVRKACVSKLKEMSAKLKAPPIPATYGAALLEAGRLALALENASAKLIQAETAITEAAPKVEYYDTVMGSNDTIDLGGAAKVLQLGFGRTTLFQKLRDMDVLMGNNSPMQRYVDAGWFRLVQSTWNKPDGSCHTYYKTVVFPKGLDGIRKLLTKKTA